VAVAGLGAVLSSVARSSFASAATAIGLDSATADVAARRVTSGDVMGMLGVVPDNLRDQLHAAGVHAFASGFAYATFAAAVVSAIGAVLTYTFVSTEETCAEAKAAQAKAALATE
jgi:hypothetical protein